MKTAVFISCVWLALLPGRGLCASSVKADAIQLSITGEYKGTLDILESDGRIFLRAKQAVELLGGTSYWYPQSKKFVISLKGLKAQLSPNSDVALFDGDQLKLPAKVILNDDRIFAPIELFTSQKFCDILDRDIVYNELAHSLDVEKRYQIGELDYFSYGAVTRLMFELRGKVAYQIEEKNHREIEIVFPGAVAQSSERVNLGDGLVRMVDVRQERDSVRVAILLGGRAKEWTTSKDADGLIVEIIAEQDQAAVAQASTQPVAAPAQEPEPAPGRFKLPDQPLLDSSNKKRIVIDAGHGGRDPGGAIRRGMSEKELNLSVAKLLEEMLRKDGIFEVLMVRSSDYYVPLAVRSSIANEYKADMFVSIHANAYNRKSENGFEIYFMSENASDPWAAQVAANENSVLNMENDYGPDPAEFLLHSLARNEYMNEGSQLAGTIARSLTGKTPIENRGVKQAAFYVLRGTYAPAVLVEIGFMTSKRDIQYLNSRDHRQKIARGIYDGIMKYAKAKGWQ